MLHMMQTGGVGLKVYFPYVFVFSIYCFCSFVHVFADSSLRASGCLQAD